MQHHLYMTFPIILRIFSIPDIHTEYSVFCDKRKKRVPTRQRALSTLAVVPKFHAGVFKPTANSPIGSWFFSSLRSPFAPQSPSRQRRILDPQCGLGWADQGRLGGRV